MKKLSLFFISLLITIKIFSQTIIAPAILKTAKVEGSVIDMRSKEPKNNELIVFKSQKNNKEYAVKSDKNGKFSTQLPAGDQYDIFIMGFKDSIRQNVLDIPALEPVAYYKDPFIVNLEFDPPKVFVLQNVEFDFGKANLRPQSDSTLNDLVEYLKRKPDVRIEIGGFTDNVGSQKRNLMLSLERAKSISKYLVAKGINKERLLTKGYGAESPLEKNDSEEGRQKNRRIEVKILDQDK